MNLLLAKLDSSGDTWYASIGGSRLLIPSKARAALRPFAGHEVVLGLHPEDFVSTDNARDGQHGIIETTVERVESLGSELLAYLSINGAAASRPLTVRLDHRAAIIGIDDSTQTVQVLDISHRRDAYC